jgi:hypothetical protein
MARHVLRHGPSPQDRCLQDVGLVDGAEPALAGAGRLDGRAGDPLDLALAVDHGVDRLQVAVRERGRLLGLAEVQAARQLAYAHDVDPVGDALVLDRGGGLELLVEETGPDVREEREVLP